MRSLVLCFIALVAVYALLQDGQQDLTFAPEVPSVYLRNVDGPKVSFVNIFKEPSHFKNLEALALDYADQLIAPATYVVKSSYQTKRNGVQHVYLKQTANDLEILNGDLNINVFDNKVLSIGHSFYQREEIPEPVPQFSSLTALHHLGKFLGTEFELAVLSITSDQSKGKDFQHTITGYPSAISDVKAKLGYLQVEDGNRLELVWDYEVDVLDHWWNAEVSAVSGEVLALYDWVDNADNYNVYPIGVNDPDDGSRALKKDPYASNASPLGWRDQGLDKVHDDTIGNNVYAQENWAGGSSWLNNLRPKGIIVGNDVDFNFPVTFTQLPDYYINAATTNLFYWNNVIHDVFYQYGFDEVSGNFQENNFGRGGREVDAVQANCQDGSGTNNANFATPPDGSRPRMRMYVWTRSTPHRDGDLDNGIIIHEYGHGISNRLTGGPANVNCLSTAQAGGMGEGWGDWWATALRQQSTYTRFDVFPMAPYSANDPEGIRNYPYTTNMDINPETYSFISTTGYTGVHAKGAVWCGILWEAYWNFVDVHGFQADWYNLNLPGGNIMIMADIVDALKLQPCNPTFIQARDAIIQADEVNWGGQNECLLWEAFAKRGLGYDARFTTVAIDGYALPAWCL